MNYIAQCKHKVSADDNYCPVCKSRIERIWNIDNLGIENATKLAEAWGNNMKPNEFYEKEILPYDRNERIFKICSDWDDNNPNANEITRNNAFKEIIKNAYRSEYERSYKDYEYYHEIKTIYSKDRNYITI